MVFFHIRVKSSHHTHPYGVVGGRLGIILLKQFEAIMGVWGAIANEMEASQETCFWSKNNPSPLQIIKRYVPMKLPYSHIGFFLKAYVEILERNYIAIWGSGGPQKPATFQRIR